MNSGAPYASRGPAAGTVHDVPAYRRHYGIRAWLLAPVLAALREGFALMAIDTSALAAAVARSGSTIAQLVVLLSDSRGKIAALNAALETANANTIDDATREQLRSLTASLDANADAAASVLADPVADPNVPTGDVAQPPASNPATPDPASVPGSVEATQPLPEDVDPNGHSQPQHENDPVGSAGDGALEQAAESAQQQAQQQGGSDADAPDGA